MVVRMLANRVASRFLNYEIMEGRGAGIDWCFGPKNFVKILDGNYDDEPQVRDGDGEDWVVDTYRKTDLANHSDHKLWQNYLNHCAGLPPRTAPPFNEWVGYG